MKLPCIALYCIALHCSLLCCIALSLVALHFIALLCSFKRVTFADHAIRTVTVGLPLEVHHVLPRWWALN